MKNKIEKWRVAEALLDNAEKYDLEWTKVEDIRLKITWKMAKLS